jgi:NADH-quinone oxidoreductase subunit G
VLSDVLGARGERTSYFLASEVFAAMATDRPAFAGLSYDSLGLKGAPANAGQLAEAAP